MFVKKILRPFEGLASDAVPKESQNLNIVSGLWCLIFSFFSRSAFKKKVSLTF